MLKRLLKNILKKIPIDFTQNQRYDSETVQVIRRTCRNSSNCIDVGAHKGEVLDKILQVAPKGTHFAFEPIPALYAQLKEKYRLSRQMQVKNIALSDQSGETSFNYVLSNPSYSGLKKRRYDRKNETDTLITVTTARLDQVVPPEYCADFIKIDVEGGEFQVLQGAAELITRSRPVIIFEHGLGASDYYGTQPGDVYDLLVSYGLQVSLMKRWLRHMPPLTRDEFENIYKNNSDYYFIAYPLNK